ncbi:MAG: helix-turn-helix domain-containing protein [Ktedonobacterales bacterium]
MSKKNASSAQPRREPEGAGNGKHKIGNALGMLIERHFAEPSSPCRSYSDLERRSGISREALSRYVTTRSDRRRSPTIDTLATIAGALHLSLEEICRAAAAAAKGAPLPAGEVGRSRSEVLLAVTETLSDAQFNAVIELLRQMHPIGASTDSRR